jgi:hypothetical protein
MAQQIKIDFIKMDVHDDADNFPNGSGEIFFEFKVDNDVVAVRSRNNPVTVDSGGSFGINESHIISREPGQNFTVFGTVSEADDVLSGGDDNAGSFQHVFSSADGFNPGDKSVRLAGDGLDVTVHYKVTLI